MDVRDTVGEVVSKRLTEQLLNIVGLDDILLVYELDVGLGECFGFFMIFKDKKDRKIARSQSLVSLCTVPRFGGSPRHLRLVRCLGLPPWTGRVQSRQRASAPAARFGGCF